MIYFEGWPDLGEFEKCSEAFNPFVARQVHFPNVISIEDVFSSCDRKVDISCVSVGKEFSGDESLSEYVPLSGKSYVEGFLAVTAGYDHWITQVKDLQLYMSQVSLWSASSPQQHSCITEEHWPKILLSKEIYQCNMWANIAPAITTLHYDSNHNILFVASGYKDILLISPAHTSCLKANGVFSTSPHHSQLSSIDLNRMFPDVVANPGLPVGIYRQRVGPGDALFIPEGWWHQVSSGPTTYALNFWFRSPLFHLLRGAHGTGMSEYLFRAALVEMSSAACDSTNSILEASRDVSISTSGPTLSLISKLFDSMSSSLPPAPDTPLQSIYKHTSVCVHEAEAEAIKKLCEMFAIASVAEMWAVWVPAVSKYPSQWLRVVFSLTPSQCHALTRLWEAAEQSEIISNKERSSDEISLASMVELSDRVGTGTSVGVKELCAELFAVRTSFENNPSQAPDLALQMRAYIVSQNNAYLEAEGDKLLHRIVGHRRRSIVSECSESCPEYRNQLTGSSDPAVNGSDVKMVCDACGRICKCCKCCSSKSSSNRRNICRGRKRGRLEQDQLL